MKAWVRILIVAAACVAGLAAMVVHEGMARTRGTEILLSTDVVDPRSLLSGHYVVIGLVEQLRAGEECPIDLGAYGEPRAQNALGLRGASDASWVAFKAEDGHHRVIGARMTREEALQLSPIVTRGAAWCQPPLSADGMTSGQPGVINADIGVYRYYASQADSERISNVLWDQRGGEERRVYAIVSIGPDGYARLKGLMVDGKRLELSWM